MGRHFGSHFGLLWELISATFFYFGKNGFIAHGGEIKGPAAEQASKEAAKMEGKSVKKQAWKNNDFLLI